MPVAMRLEPRDSSGRRLARIEIDERARPPRVAIPPAGGDLFLRWDEALDDAGALRRCVVCGCAELYARKSLPQVTPLVVVLALSGAVVAVLGYANDPVVFALLATLLAVDVLTLALARRQLVCYGCGALYERLRIARYHRRWDRAVAERLSRAIVDLPTVLQEPREEPREDPRDEPRGEFPATVAVERSRPSARTEPEIARREVDGARREADDARRGRPATDERSER